MSYLSIVFSSFCVYIFILAGLRLFGKRDLAQMSMVDVVFILLISNAVQNAMVGPDTTLLGGLVAAATMFAVNLILKFVIRKFPKLDRALQGQAMMLIYNGKIVAENLRKSGIGLDELEEVIREHGVSSVDEVNLAILETDGNVSILSDHFQSKTTHRRRARPKVKKK